MHWQNPLRRERMDTAPSEHAKTSRSEAHGQRLNYAAQSPELFAKLADLATAIRKSSIEETIINLTAMAAASASTCM
jgi:hypothetical protein